MYVNKSFGMLIRYVHRAGATHTRFQKHNLTFPHKTIWPNTSSRKIFTGSGKLVDVPQVTKLAQYLNQNHSIDDFDLSRIIEVDNLDALTEEQRSHLIHYCGNLLSNKSLEYRRKLCDKIWNKFARDSLNVTDYNTYLQTCTENEVAVNHKQFVPSMTCEPNRDTFTLLLENACAIGDHESAMEILTTMKLGCYTIDEKVFNLLVLGHTINKGLRGGQGVLETMRAAHIPETSETHWCLLKGLAKRNNGIEFFNALENPLLKFNGNDFLRVLLTLGTNDNHTWLFEIKRKFEMDTLPRNLHGDLKHVCVNLVQRGKAEIAVEIYCDLVESNVDVKFLFEEMFSVQSDVANIKNVVKYLINSGKNSLALEDVTEIALRQKDLNVAKELLADFKVLRPHYFWPLLLKASSEHGEIGILNTMADMMSMNVTIDTDTLELYCLPYCDLSNPKQLLLRLEGFGFTLRRLLSPILVTLLKNGRIKAANDLCNDFALTEQSPRLLRALALAWRDTKDIGCTVEILQRINDLDGASSDDVGTFLMHAFKACWGEEDYQQFLKLAKAIGKEKMRIFASSAENFAHIVNGKDKCTMKSTILDVIDDLLDLSKQQDVHNIKHPRDMTVRELECHLAELTGKNMETRGVLRRLLQEYSRLGNYERLRELRESFVSMSYEESPGMKAGLLKGFIQNGQLHEATKLYRDITTNHPLFRIDEYKIIELAALMIKGDKFDDAISLLTEYQKDSGIRGGAHIEKNCWRLLGTVKNPEQAHKLFDLLVQRKYCYVKNAMLGPVVRSYLKCDDLRGAVAFYRNCAETYNFTPLQQELMSAALETNPDLVKEIVKVTAKVHSPTSTKLTLIAALAEKGSTKALHKLLSETKSIPNIELQKRCDRWIREGKLEPLKVLSDAASRIQQSSVFNRSVVHLAIVQIYSRKNDCDGALSFVNRLQEKDEVITKQMNDELHSLFRRCKYTVPNTVQINRQ